MKNFAIKGHATRGREVIELLEMLGGVNNKSLYGVTTGLYYFIDYKEICSCEVVSDIYIIFTLEEFLEKFPHKVGDKVCYIKYNDEYPSIYIIKSMRWTGTTIEYSLDGSFTCLAKDLQPYKEETMEGKLISNEEVSLRINISQIEKRQIIFSTDSPNETELVLGDNFEIEVEDGKTYVVRKKPKYPKTYEECCDVLKIPNHERYIDIDVPLDYNKLFYAFTKLLICRDAYWKIAGDFKYDVNKTEEYFYIVNKCGRIVKEHYMNFNHILAFPTEEMRDAFYKYFKDLIEQCEELL